MRRPCLWLLGSWALMVAPGVSPGGEIPNGLGAVARQTRAAAVAPKAVAAAKVVVPIKIPNGPSAFAPRVVVPIDDRTLADAIDRALSARWSAMGLTPAPRAGDAEFLRR